MPSQPVPLVVSPSRAVRLLAAAAAALVVAGLLGVVARYGFGHDQVKGLVPLFDLDGEQNVPTWFAVALLLAAAGGSALTGRVERRRAPERAGGWFLLATGFLLMSYDEAFQFHEGLILPMRAVLGDAAHGPLYYAWVVPGSAAVAIAALLLLRFLTRLPRATARRFVAAGGVYVAGAIGMELISGRWIEVHGMFNLPNALMAATEEAMELAGLVLFHRGALLHWGDQALAVLVTGDADG